MTDRLIRITTALAVAAVAAVAAVISYRHAYELVSTHGETRYHCAACPVHHGRAHSGREHAPARCQPPEPPRTTPGAVVPWCRNRRDHRCQPGAWPRPRPHRCP